MKNLILSATLIFFVYAASAQRFHVNVFAGISNYQGDLQDKFFTIDQAHFAGGLGFSYDLTNRLAVRTGFTFGKISGDDRYGRNKARNLNFYSTLTEGNIGLEYLIFPVEDHLFTPYVFVSAAIYHYNPYTFDQKKDKYFLAPLSTEGQGIVAGRENYKLTQFAIPFGGGVKFALSDNINVGAEAGFRKLSNDYLDDVSTSYIDQSVLLSQRGAKAVELSYRGDEVKDGQLQYPPAGQQRGSVGKKDWYYFSGITVSFRIGSGGLGRSSKYGCPGSVL
jgi:hypothetical protein